MLSILGDIMCGQIRKPFSAIFVEALYQRRITPRSSYSNTRTNGSSQAGASGTDRLVGVLSITGGNTSIGRVLWEVAQVLEEYYGEVTKGANSAGAPATATARQGDSDMWKKVCPMPIDKFTHRRTHLSTALR